MGRSRSAGSPATPRTKTWLKKGRAFGPPRMVWEQPESRRRGRPLSSVGDLLIGGGHSVARPRIGCEGTPRGPHLSEQLPLAFHDADDLPCLRGEDQLIASHQ